MVVTVVEAIIATMIAAWTSSMLFLTAAAAHAPSPISLSRALT